MRSIDSLLAEIIFCNQHLLVYREKVLKLSNPPDTFTREVLTYSVAFFESVILYLRTYDEKKCQSALADLLRAHTYLVMDGSLDYFNHPDFPLNSACLSIAKFLAKTSSVISVLFPAVKKIIGIPTSEGTVDFSEYISNDAFSFQNYLMASSNTQLIDIIEVCTYANNDPALFFDIDAQTRLSLSAIDRHRIMALAPALFKQLEVRYFLYKKETPTVGYALHRLSQDLLTSSKMGQGTETRADDSCQMAIRFFKTIWDELSKETKQSIENYTAENTTYTLKEYLMTLFAYIGELSDEEFDLVEKNRMVPCTYLIGKQLSDLLSDNEKLYQVVLKNTDFLQESIPTKLECLEQINVLKDRLLERKTKGEDGRFLEGVVFALDLMKHVFGQGSLIANAQRLLPLSLIKDVSTFVAFLNLTPSVFWAHVFRVHSKFIRTLIETHKKNFYFEGVDTFFLMDNTEELHGFRKNDLITYFLSRLSTHDWKNFFRLFSRHSFMYECFSSQGLAKLFYSMPSMCWQTLYNALTDEVKRKFFHDSMGIANFFHLYENNAEKINFFITLFNREWFEKLSCADYMGRFSAKISSFENDNENLFFIMRSFSVIFEKNKNDDWLLEYFSAYINEKKVLLGGVSSMIFPSAVALLEGYLNLYPQWIPKQSEKVLGILECFDKKNRLTVLKMLAPRLAIALLSNRVNFFAFFDAWNDRQLLDSAIFCVLPYLKITDFESQDFTRLVQKYPSSESELIRAFQHSFVKIYHGFFNTFKMLNSFECDLPKKLLNHFYFFSEKTLFCFLSIDFLQLDKFSTELLVTTPALTVLLNAFFECENSVKADGCLSMDASIRKLVALGDFYKVVKNTCLPHLQEICSPECVALFTALFKTRFEKLYDVPVGRKKDVASQTLPTGLVMYGFFNTASAVHLTSVSPTDSLTSAVSHGSFTSADLLELSDRGEDMFLSF